MSNSVREFQDAVLVRNVVARTVLADLADTEAAKAAKRYEESKKLMAQMDSLARKVENADASAKKKFDAAYDKLFANGEAAFKAAAKLSNKYGEDEAIEMTMDLLDRWTREWVMNKFDHEKSKSDSASRKLNQARNTYAYGVQIDSVLKEFTKLLKDENIPLDDDWRKV